MLCLLRRESKREVEGVGSEGERERKGEEEGGREGGGGGDGDSRADMSGVNVGGLTPQW